MIKLSKLLNETPDKIFYGRYSIGWYDPDAYTFGYRKRGSKKFVIVKSENKNGDMNTHGDIFGSRVNVKFPGRLWTRRRIISFWGKYPTPQELAQILKDVSEALHIKIDNRIWKLDIPTEGKAFGDNENYTTEFDSDGEPIERPDMEAGKLIPINKYIVATKRTNVDTGEKHVAPPMVKAANKAKELAAAVTPSDKAKIKAKYGVPKGMGSMRMKGNMPAAQYQRMRYPNVDETND